MELKIYPPNLTQYQRDFLYDPARYVIVEASTKCGKTFAMIWWIFELASDASVDQIGRHYWWIAPTYGQAKIAYKRLKQNLLPLHAYKFNDSEMFISLPCGSFIEFKTGEKVDHLYGQDVFGVVIDEAPRCRSDVWVAIRTTVTHTGAPCKLIGNHKGISNWVFKLKEKAKSDPSYKYFRITADDAVEAGILDESEISQAKKDLHPKQFAALYMAESIEDDGQLISYESIKKVFTNTHLEGGTKYITCDPANIGRDKAVIMLWNGFRVEKITTFDISKTNQIVDAIKALRNEYNVNGSNIVIDSDGLGVGVLDYVPGAIRFSNNAKPIGQDKRKFTNLKNQCYFKLVEMINANEIYIRADFDDERTIMEELEWIRLPKEIDDHKVQIMSKDNIKKRLGRSPDYSDALMLRMRKEVGNSGVYRVYGMSQHMNVSRNSESHVKTGSYKVI